MRNIKLKTIVLLLLMIFILTTAALYLFADKAFKILLSGNMPEIKLPEPEIENIEGESKPEIESPEESKIQEETHGSAAETPQTKVPQKDSENNKDINVDEISKNITFADKRRILLLVAKRLSAEDIRYLMGLLKGGLTENEKREAIELAFKRFSREEIDEIRALYAKYRHLTR